MEPFNSQTIELQGSNIIEASAGTGKTYSIAILVLRLLLEKKMAIQEILLVTFTDAAAAELKERTARFIRYALDEVECASEDCAKDKMIWRIVHNSIESSSEQKVKSILNKALLDIDLASIQTIHSFCQSTLTEFAFETNQIFGSELIKNTDEIINRFLNDYWRTNIAILEAKMQDLFPDDFREIIKKGVLLVLSNNNFSDKHFKILNHKEFEKEKERIEIEENQILYEYFNSRIESMKEKIVEYDKQLKKSGEKSQQTNALKKLNDNYLNFAKYLIGDPKYNFKGLFLEEIIFCKEYISSKRDLKKEYINYLVFDATQKIVPKVKQYLKKNNLLTFDALIENLHTVKDEENLRKLLRKKYKAIFIDEFQDTDKLQYEIFESVFQTNPGSVLFYIGDPKQSIYAFRKADLNTYFRAKARADHKWTMKMNFRSTDKYVAAMNDFFKDSDNFKTFYYENDEIVYQQVEASPNNKDKKGITFNGEDIYTPLEIRTDYANKDSIHEDLTNLVIKLLDGTHTIDNRPIVPSDFGILVRSNADGRAIKKRLEKNGVPAVVVDESSIFKCNEANDLNLVLNGIVLPNKSNIDKALLTQLVGYKSEELNNIDHDKVLSLFRKYHQVWGKSGIYAMLRLFLTDFGVESKWTTDDEIGHRVLSNVFQLTELLQNISISRNFTPSKLKAFLNNAIQTSDNSDDAFTQRIERDEDAVRIATIHKSKGLEYNIVLLPNLDFTIEERGFFSNFKLENEGNIEYLFTSNPVRNSLYYQLFLKQEEQENRRLIYVAITRARFNCFVFRNNFYSSSSIKSFIDKLAVQTEVTTNIKLVNGDTNKIQEVTYTANGILHQPMPLDFPTAKPNDHNWKKMSYSFLAAPHKSHTSENSTNYEEGYDRFVFKELEKGIHVGNMLHNIFEYLDFTDSTDWNKVIDISLQKFTASKKEVYAPWMELFLENILNAKIKIGDKDSFELKSVQNDVKVNELEFDFPIDETFDIKALQDLFPPSDPEFIYTGFGEVKGMMNGLVDLFFKHNDKYFILDWKSNFLGDAIEHYDEDKLTEAMNESNYHLQYCIYTVAMKRFLESKLGDSFEYDKHFGGVIYLFLRGVRKGESTGIYTNKLPLEKVEKLEGILNLTPMSKV
jgi:exodeoxyribonuclease V beta subunit